MTKKLVLAEKPSVGREIANALKTFDKQNGYIEGKNYIVTWGLGHLVELAPPENYKAEYKNWNMKDIPIIPNREKLVVIKNTQSQFNTVKRLLNRNDVEEIIIATDAGREGELVARWILEKSGVKKPMKRLWISSITEKSIREGFSNLKSSKSYDNLYFSAESRAKADWIVGINATRALTLKYNAQLSCGRVQTPTLAIIKEREDEIKSFSPKTFYNVEVTAGGIKFKLKYNNQYRIFDKNLAEKLLKESVGELKISSIESKSRKKFPPKLYDLTTLQSDCNRIYGMSAKQTLDAMQNLYERHKVLTYPRTDSNYISEDIVPTLKERLEAMAIGEYRESAKWILKKGIKKSKSFVDDSKVSDHHAIIPTEEPLKLIAMNNAEIKVYDLVAKRFLAVLMPPLEYNETTFYAKINNNEFIASGKQILDKGYTKIFEDDDEEDVEFQNLPNLKIGDKLKIQKKNLKTGATTPPAYFTEGTLLKAMENPSSYVSKNSMKKVLKETGGIGTVATRADIIEKLYNTDLIEKTGNNIMITAKGRQLLDLAPEKLKSPELTGDWELKLKKIEKGDLKPEKFMQEIKDFCKENIETIKKDEKTFVHDNLTNSECPNCGRKLLLVNRKNTKMLICQDRECGYKKVLSVLSNARCPNCHKKMELSGEGENKSFFCSCGYRESLNAFNKRKEKLKNQASKGEVKNFLKKQKDVNINNSLSAQLKGLKLK